MDGIQVQRRGTLSTMIVGCTISARSSIVPLSIVPITLSIVGQIYRQRGSADRRNTVHTTQVIEKKTY